jgi:hypothetical protein
MRESRVPFVAGGSFRRPSLETWAALIAFALAALVRAGVFKHLPW